MGPCLICDKSTLQALGKDELGALRRYYSLNVPPVLLVEILGDLKKHADIQASRAEVSILANKLLPACSAVTAGFRTLIQGELLGNRVEMGGRPVLLGGRHVQGDDGQKGVVFEVAPEAEALLRWQTDEFVKAEELLADAWRFTTQSIDVEAMQRELKSAYSGHINLRTLDQTAHFVDQLMTSNSVEALLRWFLRDIGMFGPTAQQTVQRFQNLTGGSLREQWPYTAYCIRVALIFHFALAFGLVSARPTNRVDLEYFYYTPFCNAFSSGDGFHKKIARIVLTNQTYVDRNVLKTDLKQLAKWWDALTPDQLAHESKMQGPPENEASITHQLWKQNMKPGYRNQERRRANLPKEVRENMVKRFQELGKKDGSKESLFENMDDCDFMIIKHMVRADGPCICGGTKLFKDCCGTEVVKSLKKGSQ